MLAGEVSGQSEKVFGGASAKETVRHCHYDLRHIIRTGSLLVTIVELKLEISLRFCLLVFIVRKSSIRFLNKIFHWTNLIFTTHREPQHSYGTFMTKLTLN